MDKIAVFTDENKQVTNFYNCNCIQIYKCNSKDCFLEHEIAFNKIQPISPRQIREETVQVSCLVEDCVAVVFGEILGVAYSVFDSKKFNIFTIEDYNEEIIKGICSDLADLEEELKNKIELSQAGPQETEDCGVYYFDLVAAQANNPTLTSKQALKEFIDTTPFLELRLKVAHVPPWLKNYTSLKIKAQQVGGYVQVTLRP